MEKVGRVAELYRYPVKSMGGESLEAAEVGWNGIEGDRRLGFLRRGVAGGRPWLTAGKLGSLVAYRPLRREGEATTALPQLVRLPDGRVAELRSEELREEISSLAGTPVDLVELVNGIFDDAPLSLIVRQTVAAITEGAGVNADVRRFRPNVLIDADDAAAYGEDAWIGRTMQIGDDGPRLQIAMRDVRCAMINLDPDTGASDPRLLKEAVRQNGNNAGVYAMVVRTGTVRVGDTISLI